MTEKLKDLKLCPFCKEAKNIPCRSNQMGNGFVARYHCLKCGAEGPPVFRANIHEATKVAAAEWNRRAESPNDPLTVEELKKMVGDPVYTCFEDDPPEWDILKGITEDQINLSEIRLNTGYLFTKQLRVYRRRPEGEEQMNGIAGCKLETYDIEDLNGKTLTIKVEKRKGMECLYGMDLASGKAYLLRMDLKPGGETND